MTILIVDDNANVRRLLRQLLKHLGAEVVECQDGADAAAAYAQHHPHVVLMDIGMPRLNGLAATRLLLQQFPEARVVIVTDYADDVVREAAAASGACDFMPKEDLAGLDEVVQRAARIS